MSNISDAKKIPNLTIGDRIDIVKNKRVFSFIFPISILILIIIIFGIGTKGTFFQSNVLLGIFNQAIITGTMATAVSFIYSTGNLDISVGSVMALGATIGAGVYIATGSIPLMIIVAVVTCILAMLVNCTLSVLLGIKPIVVAIVMMQLYNAVISEILGPNSLKVDLQVCKALENSGFRYIAFLLYFIICLMIYHHTSVGRELRFIGGNEECARQTGINAKKTTYISFIMAGIGIGLAAVFTIIRTGTVSNATGGSMGMDVMLATVLGGMSIFGGAKSNTYSGILGALTVVALNKGLLMVDVSASIIQLVRGVIFLVLVFINVVRPETLPTKQQV